MVTDQGNNDGGIDDWVSHDVDIMPGEEEVLYPMEWMDIIHPPLSP